MTIHEAGPCDSAVTDLMEGTISGAITCHARPSSEMRLAQSGTGGPAKAFLPLPGGGERWVPVSAAFADLLGNTAGPFTAATPALRSEALCLALDNALWIEIDGVPLSGTRLLAALQGDGDMGAGEAGTDRLSALAARALHLAQVWPLGDHYAMVGALYFHNRLPVLPDWQSPPEASPQPEIGAIGGQAFEASLSGAWQRADSEPEWRLWRRRGMSVRGAVYKLYVSVHPDALPEALMHAAPVFTAQGAHAFKVGATRHGVMRPDSLIGYFASRSGLDRAADALRLVLDPQTARGALFTVPLDDTGLLSWGRDPARDSLARAEGSSWRLWLCSRLAHGIACARMEQDPCLSPAAFARRRLSFWGVDPQQFGPLPGADARRVQESGDD